MRSKLSTPCFQYVVLEALECILKVLKDRPTDKAVIDAQNRYVESTLKLIKECEAMNED